MTMFIFYLENTSRWYGLDYWDIYAFSYNMLQKSPELIQAIDYENTDCFQAFHIWLSVPNFNP